MIVYDPKVFLICAGSLMVGTLDKITKFESYDQKYQTSFDGNIQLFSQELLIIKSKLSTQYDIFKLQQFLF